MYTIDPLHPPPPTTPSRLRQQQHKLLYVAVRGDSDVLTGFSHGGARDINENLSRFICLIILNKCEVNQ